MLLDVVPDPALEEDRAGRHGVDPHAVGGGRVGELAGVGQQRGLHGAVGALIRWQFGEHARDAGDQHDRPGAGVDQRRHRGAAASHAVHQVDVERRLPQRLLVGVGCERHVSHEDVEPAELLDGPADPGLVGVGVGDVHRFPPGRVSQLGHRGGHPVGAAGADRDPRALVDERAGDGEPDPPRGPGDDRLLAVQFQIHVLLRSVNADRGPCLAGSRGEVSETSAETRP